MDADYATHTPYSLVSGVWQSMVKRDPEYFWPTVHAIQQKKTRGIDWDAVSETIRHGEARPTHKENVWLYIHDCGYEDLVGVVASNETGEILTIEYRH